MGFLSGVAKMAWDVLSRVTKTAWNVLSGVANLCGMFCPGCQKMAWDVLSRCNGQFFPQSVFSPGKEWAGPFFPRGKN